MEPILYRAEPDGRLTPLRSDVGVRILFAGSWLSLSAGALVARVAAGTIDHGHLVSAKLLLPHRGAALAPYGWAPPVFGHDDLGRPCALILPAEAPPPPPLAQVQAEAHAQRTAERYAREATQYPHAGHRYDCDERSAIRWGLVVSMALLAMGSDPDAVIVPSGWRDTEGTPRLYTAAQILAAQQSLLLWGAQCDAASQAIGADIDAATDTAAAQAILAAIPTDARWPT